MARELLVKFTIDWEDYEDISDEFMLIDLELDKFMKDGVGYELIKPRAARGE